MKIEFLRTRKIGVAGARSDEFFGGGIVLGIVGDGENFFPVGPIAIFDAQGDGRADGLAVADSGENVSAVFFNFLATTASVAELAAVQLAIDEFEVDGEASRQAGEKCQEWCRNEACGSSPES
jgi:hypothetical protein